MTPLRRDRLAAGLALRLLAGLTTTGLACGGAGGLAGTGVERQSAQALGTVSRELPDDAQAQALQALRQDAWRREHRFLDAADPGHLYRSVRIRQVEIDSGLWTLDELYQVGGQLFALPFTRGMGMGGGDGPLLRRFHAGLRGGPDALGCTDCHRRGGPAGAGDLADDAMLRGDGIHESSTIARNPPALVGAGLRERLAVEMSTALQTIRDQALARAAQTDAPVRLPLHAKGVGFGFITAHPSGEVDPGELDGIDVDLVIKPFGWKGTTASLRDAVEDELLVHHGMQSEHLVIEGDAARVGPYGGDDPDGDGVIQEITEGQVTALTLFLAMQEVPQQEVPDDDPYLAALWARGQTDFQALGCAACHVPALPLDSAELVLPHRYGGPWRRVDLMADGAQPRLAPDAETGELSVRLYSDLRRHAMGLELAEDRAERGVAPDVFLTPPLWGLAHSRPYLHDGRAATVEEAILLHGGEALAARDAYARLPDEARAPLRVFLASLVRARRL
ncbi:MAG: hypothetical protein KDK70_21520, partial [Myxococcales bacterium]|nr:hypothetical protein [Myxococcales bacterium]